MSFLRSKRGVVLAAALVVLLMFVVRPGANRLKGQIVRLIETALGRPVEVASVRIRLLPQPGFVLENFTIHDDASFGAEPMLRAQEVTASLRLTSLLRGRLEVARLDLTDPSLNLAWSPESHWNVASLIVRTAHASIAPTAKPSGEPRPAFPYIEGNGGRINFKLGSEKKPYALTEAEFSFWQESEDTWAMRLQARPVRTDLNLSDTGVVHADGTWKRASSLAETPLHFDLEWSGAQLGQATKLIYGDDQGWRGTLDLSVSLQGIPADAALTVAASAADFRRFDVLGGGALNLAARCGARYSSIGNAFSAIACEAPVGDGALRLNGSLAHPAGARSYDLLASAQSVPAPSLLAFAQHVQNGVPSGLRVTGRVDAEFRGVRHPGQSTGSWTGDGRTSGIRFRSGNEEIALGAVPLILSSSSQPFSRKKTLTPPPEQPAETLHLTAGPFHVPMGRTIPLTVEAQFARKGYQLQMQGDAQVPRLVQAANLFAIPVPQVTAEGAAGVELQLSRDWSSSEAVRPTGKLQLHAIHAQVRSFNSPLDIQSANLILSHDQVTVQNLVASLAGTEWRGSLLLMRPCGGSAGCSAKFDLRADEIAFERMNKLLNPQERAKPWYQVITSLGASGAPFLLSIDATGKLTSDKLFLRGLEARRITANVELKHGVLEISNFAADVLGGRHTGEWKADFTVKPPRYEGIGSFQGVALGQLASLMNDGWISGFANGDYKLNLSGLNAKALLGSATGTLRVEAAKGALPHIELTEGAGPLAIEHLTAQLSLHDGKFEIQDGKLNTTHEVFQLSGTASMAQVLNLKLTRPGASGFSVTGPLAGPHVFSFAAPETRAALKQ